MNSRSRTRRRRFADALLGISGFGPRVEYWQRQRGLSDETLAREVGISVELLEHIRKVDQPEVSAGTRRKLAKVLGVTVGQLVE
jgi:ribosome-binding protein aMBF1 (putative translation factor)